MNKRQRVLTPFRCKILRSRENSASLEYGPFDKGMGTTVGNVLRRVALSRTSGTKITAIIGSKIGCEYSYIPGISCDIQELCNNLKQVDVYTPSESVYTLSISKSGAGSVFASDISCPSGVRVLTPEIFLFSMDGSNNVEFDIIVESNVGKCAKENLVSFDENRLGVIYLHDAYIFTPVKTFAFEVVPYNFGKRESEILILHIETNGVTTPSEVVAESANIFIEVLSKFKSIDITSDMQPQNPQEPNEFNQVCFKMISDMEGFTQRSINALTRIHIKYIGDLLCQNSDELNRNINSLGVKSATNIKDTMKAESIAWITDEEKWREHKEKWKELSEEDKLLMHKKYYGGDKNAA